MFKRIFKLFQISRNLSSSGAVEVIKEIYPLPTILSVFFNIISIGSNTKTINKRNSPGEKLCEALQNMGTTFI